MRTTRTTFFIVSLFAGLSAGPVAGCASTAEPEVDGVAVDALAASKRLERETTIRDVAAQFGLRNGALLAGLAEAEVFLQHCWSEAQWACQGPFSAECGGPVVAGSGDGACALQRGGLGMFQFDRGTHAQTLGAHGAKILGVAGSVEEAVTFVAAMAVDSAYTPANVVDRASALAWLNEVRIDGPSYDAWLKTVVHYYNGCAPGQCSVYEQRRQKYDGALRTVWNERGAAFWQGAAAAAGRAWVMPFASNGWRVDFGVVNPHVGGTSACFGKPLNQLVHAGEDWAAAAGTAVRAVGPGTVVYAANANYPGWVVVVRHDLTDGERAALGLSTSTVYSQYGHLANVQVAVGQSVAAGQQLASVLNQSANSHLHWEVRTAQTPQLCAFTPPGPGYTNTGTQPQAWGYVDPENAVLALRGAGGGAQACDNNVPPGGTACAAQGQAVEYVCARPGQPSAQQWDTRACAPGATCQGDRCQGGGGTCGAQTSSAACDAQGGACAWYGCANRCEPMGTDINQVCPTWCSTHATLPACNATGGACAWYACADACRPSGTPLGQVCP